jgi:hypothetical protein
VREGGQGMRMRDEGKGQRLKDADKVQATRVDKGGGRRDKRRGKATSHSLVVEQSPPECRHTFPRGYRGPHP